MFFRSYKDAHRALKLSGSWQRGTIGNKATGISSLKMTNNPESLDLISDDLAMVFYVGIGKKNSQGEPSENQTEEDQEPFFVSKANKTPIPILIKLEGGTVFYAGLYKVKFIRLKEGPRGILYYQIVLEQ